MSQRVAEFKALWDELSPPEQAELLAYFRSQEAVHENSEPDGLSEEWVQEINRRVQAYKNGESIPVNGAEFMAKLKAKYS